MEFLSYSFAAFAILSGIGAWAFAQPGRNMNSDSSPGEGNRCTLAGTCHGGSVVSYQMPLTPTSSSGEYIAVFRGRITPQMEDIEQPLLAIDDLCTG